VNFHQPPMLSILSKNITAIVSNDLAVNNLRLSGQTDRVARPRIAAVESSSRARNG